MAEQLWSESQEGTKVLDRLQRNDSTLNYIGLYGKHLTDVDVKKLAEALKANTTLTKLHLRYNAIEDVGATALADALKDNTTVTDVDLRENDGITKPILNEIDEIMQRNKNIVDLGLSTPFCVTEVTGEIWSGDAEPKFFKSRFKNFFSLERKTKIKNKSDQKIKVIISYQPMTVILGTKVEAAVLLPILSIKTTAGREREIQMGEHPPQQAVILPNSREVFELPWKSYYLTVTTQQPDGSCVIHEKDRFVRSSQNWKFEQSDLGKVVEILSLSPPP